VILIGIPIALAGWVVWRGSARPRGEGPQPVAQTPAAPAPAAPVRSDDETLLALFASAVGPATLHGEVTLYDDQKLFDYIDGAAPLYLQRHFRKLAATEMTTADGGELTCDVYDMRAPENAESIFAAERSSSAQAAPAWPEALLGKRSLVFRRGRYYAKLTAFDDKAEARLPAIGQALRERMR